MLPSLEQIALEPTTRPYISLGDNLKVLYEQVNSDLKSLTDWFRANQLLCKSN